MPILRVPEQYVTAIEANKQMDRCFDLLASVDTTGCRSAANKAYISLQRLYSDFYTDPDAIKAMAVQMVEILFLGGRSSLAWDYVKDLPPEMQDRIAVAEKTFEKISHYAGSLEGLKFDIEVIIDIICNLHHNPAAFVKLLSSAVEKT